MNYEMLKKLNITINWKLNLIDMLKNFEFLQ